MQDINANYQASGAENVSGQRPFRFGGFQDRERTATENELVDNARNRSIPFPALGEDILALLTAEETTIWCNESLSALKAAKLPTLRKLYLVEPQPRAFGPFRLTNVRQIVLTSLRRMIQSHGSPDLLLKPDDIRYIILKSKPEASFRQLEISFIDSSSPCALYVHVFPHEPIRYLSLQWWIFEGSKD